MLDVSRLLIEEKYAKAGETAEDALLRACNAWGSNPEHSARLYDYCVNKRWFMWSSPTMSNAPDKLGNFSGMPISCFLTSVFDNKQSLVDHTSELRYLSMAGGGVGGTWSDIRTAGDKSYGTIPFIHTVDADMRAYHQGKTRRGSYAAYLDISHPEIMEFLKIRDMKSGDLLRKAGTLHHAVNITDDFIKAVNEDGMWDLINPSDGRVTDTVKARMLWEEILTIRYKFGEPYINFIDEANRHLHPALKDLGLKIMGSNLCNEIHLVADEKRTAVCCLLSTNLVYFNEWSKHPLFIRDLIEALDNVLTHFIKNAPPELAKAVYSAFRERSLGLGAMGFHDHLMKHGIPWESAMAVGANKRMFRHIKTKALEATKELAAERGEAPDGIGYGVRNLHLLAIAPNANSGILLDCVSPSIEPRLANFYVQRTRIGTIEVKNPWLERDLEEIGMNTKEVWNTITSSGGSIQGLTGLPDWMYDVYKTAYELDQHWVIEHARGRQEFICQGQSVNTFFPAFADRGYVNSVHRRAFAPANDTGVPLKGLYYLRTEPANKAESVNTKVERVALKDVNECIACEG